ncbi:hypothetical protein KP509_22G036300 [Ceratopteris richardii]|uniref:Uncharacterized protein n=1 Tax=Ceratopteris richardii TaxID=49495 RepID=A0A8T2S7A0_CERRI|nr:hypothetical protein KP509_22G036300 [Ceratopteris richardii]
MTGICLGNVHWKNSNPSLAQRLELMLDSSGYRVRFLTIAPDFIFNSMGLSVAFLLITEWNEDTITAALDRSKTFEIAMPPFIPVNDGQMALERMLNLADVHAECKRQGTVSQVDNEREDLVCSNDAFVVAISSIHGLTPHDANTLQQGIGSIEEIMAASKEDILDNTDLSAEKADAVVKFFHDPPFYMNPVPPSTRN